MDLFVEVEPNPNCEAADGMLYQALEPPQVVTRIRMARDGRDQLCWVTGVEPGPRWVPARAQKITDSGAGVAYCLTGGRWGLRFQRAASADTPPRSFGQPAAETAAPWGLADSRQWGEPYKIYGSADDLVFRPA